jgi:hypothetical protein
MKKKQPIRLINGAHSVKKAKRKLTIKTAIPIEHVLPIDQKVIFANHFAVQNDNGVYHLIFFQITPPLIIGSDEAKAKMLGDLNSVQAVCTARIVVANEFMPKIIQALVENHGTMQAAAVGNVEIVDVRSTSQ